MDLHCRETPRSTQGTLSSLFKGCPGVRAMVAILAAITELRPVSYGHNARSSALTPRLQVAEAVLGDLLTRRLAHQHKKISCLQVPSLHATAKYHGPS